MAEWAGRPYGFGDFLGGGFLTEEKALELYARGYNRRDFTAVARKLHRSAELVAFNRFYRHDGKDSVARYLREKADELAQSVELHRAYHGFMMVPRGMAGVKCESCVVLTKSNPPLAEGIVRIRCSPLGILEIQILDPERCEYTRGDFAG